MAVYVLASYDIDDAEAYGAYVPGVVPLLQKHGAEILVADYEPLVIEGQACGVNVVLRFDSEEAAQNWYNDPAYGPVRQVRLGATSNGSIAIVKPFTPPTP